jgi:ABC-type branched-subunit amino acid transport system ATPase component/ABC-type branched-subunit amino acid transport system permease subunit
MALVGLPALRVPGLTLAVTTLGFGVIASDWLFRQSWLASASSFGSTVKPARLASGLGTPRTELSIYYVALAVLVLVGAAGSALRRSAPGRLVVAVRDNERASAAFGVTPATVKLGILAVSGFVAAAGGVLWAEAWGVASPSQFSADVSVSVLAVPVIGGLGSLGGAVAAAVVLYGSTFFIGPSFNAVFGRFGQNLGFQLFLAGVLLIGTMLRFPKGLAGVAQASWQRFLDRRSARVRSSWDRSAADLPLQMSEVRVHFGGVTALDGPEIIVRPGEIVGLIGPNGAGKTTLMNVISGVITPDAGSVRLFGHEVVDLPPDLRAAYGLARSFQDATLFPGLTVTETVQVALGRGHKIGVIPAMLGAPWVRSRERTSLRQANEIVERFGLAAWAQVMTSELSTGTRRICDLAAQVAAEPKLLMLDEPTAGVAQRDAEAFGPLLRQIRDELDCSVLIVEHDMPLLMGLCDRVYAMEAGRVIAEGTPTQIRNDPAVVASYLGNETVAITRSGARKPRPASTNGSSSNSSKKGASDSRTTGSSGSTRRRSS